MLAFRLRRLSLAAMFSFCLPLSGCDASLEIVSIRILDFDTSAIEGASIWRLSEASGVFERVSDVPFTRAILESGEEALSYPVADDAGREFTLWAAFERDPADPGIATVRFVWRRSTDAGTFKVSTFNAVGHSPLSEGVIRL